MEMNALRRTWPHNFFLVRIICYGRRQGLYVRCFDRRKSEKLSLPITANATTFRSVTLTTGVTTRPNSKAKTQSVRATSDDTLALFPFVTRLLCGNCLAKFSKTITRYRNTTGPNLLYESRILLGRCSIFHRLRATGVVNDHDVIKECVQTFKTGECSEDDIHHDGKDGTKIEDWIHLDERPESLVSQDPELKSLLQELVSDFGQNKYSGSDLVDDESENAVSTSTMDNKDDHLDAALLKPDNGEKAEENRNEECGRSLDFMEERKEEMNFVTSEDSQGLEPLDGNDKEERRFVFTIDDLVSILREENAQDICVINIPKERCYVDYFVIVTGRSPRHLKAMSLHINQQYKERKTKQHPFVLVEGDQTEDWMCIDFGNIVLHLMSEETREFYELEKLWTLGSEYDEQLRRLKEYDIKMNVVLSSVSPEINGDENSSAIDFDDSDARTRTTEMSFVK